MKSRRTVTTFLALSAILALCSWAFAGVEPSPFYTLISNRTDRLPSGSTFHNQTMHGMELILRVSLPPSAAGGAGGEDTLIIPILDANGGYRTLSPGETLAFPPMIFDVPESSQIIFWSFTAKMGIEPVPWKGFAFPTKLAEHPPEPGQPPPALAPSYLTGEMPILGFASPGVLVGTVALVNDELFYNLCPSVPQVGTSWKNHGQYVRCIAQQADYLVFMGEITQEEADAIVSGAAQSEVGQK